MALGHWFVQSLIVDRKSKYTTAATCVRFAWIEFLLNSCSHCILVNSLPGNILIPRIVSSLEPKIFVSTCAQIVVVPFNRRSKQQTIQIHLNFALRLFPSATRKTFATRRRNCIPIFIATTKESHGHNNCPRNNNKFIAESNSDEWWNEWVLKCPVK